MFSESEVPESLASINHPLANLESSLEKKNQSAGIWGELLF